MALHGEEQKKGSTPAEGLTSDSSEQEIQQAIIATISQLVEEGFPQEQAQQIALEQAKKAMGREAGERQSGVRRAS